MKDRQGVFRGWVVTLSSLCMTLTFGLLYSYSDFFIPLQQEFGWNHTIDSTIPALSLIVFSFGCPLAAYLMSRLGARKISVIGSVLVGTGTIASSLVSNYIELLILFGVVLALGAAVVVLLSNTLVVKWFVKRRGVAVGIAASGSGLGTLLIPPIAEKFILSNGWRISLALLGVGFLVILLSASYFMQTPQDRSLSPYGWESMTKEQREGYRDYTLRQAVSSARFWMIYAMFFLGTFGMTMFVIHSVPLAKSEGIDFVTASEALGLFGAGSLFSRVVIGALSDKLGGARSLIVAFVVEFAGMISVPFVGGIVSLLFLAAFAIGFGFGGFLADLIGLTGDVFGMKFVESIWGWVSTGYGFGGVAGPIFAGLYFDKFGSYGGAFEVGAAGVAIALLISVYFSIRKEPKMLSTLA